MELSYNFSPCTDTMNGLFKSKQTNKQKKVDLFGPLNRVTLMWGISETGQLVTVKMEMGVSVTRL